jgi:hypothetical protein
VIKPVSDGSTNNQFNIIVGMPGQPIGPDPFATLPKDARGVVIVEASASPDPPTRPTDHGARR